LQSSIGSSQPSDPTLGFAVDTHTGGTTCFPGYFVLIAYGRVNAGAVQGDPGVITRFSSLFPPM
jgi:hypothetical protein